MGSLNALVNGRLYGDESIQVTDATHDSRQVAPGWLFIAVKGARFDGHDFAAQAVARGAAAVVGERRLPLEVPQLILADARRSMGVLAAAIHDHPSSKLDVLGVTGTNGKTTVTHYLEAIASQAGRPCGLIGTVNTRLLGQTIPNPHTTPEATDFQRLLHTMAEGGAELVACEVSSHALALGRVAATRFATAAFTNLSQDHLDLHGSMESYFETKASLFEQADQKVIWVDDPYGARLAARYPEALTAGTGGQIRCSQVKADLTGSNFLLHLPDETVEVRIRLPGPFNVANATLAAAVAHASGFPSGAIHQGLAGLISVPGRFEVMEGSDGVIVVVDYAHTPEGIASVIAAARSLARGRVIAVFGAGGDRDRAKRPAMGQAASAADLLVVTSDNPRSEDPEKIIDQVMAGIDNPACLRVADRKEAISTALGSAASGDIVLILGKGHEQGQEVAGVIHPFDDRAIVSAWWEERR